MMKRKARTGWNKSSGRSGEKGFPFPVLILVSSTLTIQWQIEMMDKLGIPSAVWSSQKKVWLGVEGQILSPRGDSNAIKKCPYRIAIISTGLIMHQKDDGDFIKEAGMLLKNKYGTVILDEAHKARAKGGLGSSASQPNNLLTFMQQMGKRTRHLILGTASPIQTEVRELWDLLGILNSGAESEPFRTPLMYCDWLNRR